MLDEMLDIESEKLRALAPENLAASYARLLCEHADQHPARLDRIEER